MTEANLYRIEKGVPLAETKRRSAGGRPRLYPWLEMEPGDSFYVKGKSAKAFNGSACDWGKKLRRKYTVRDVKGGARVWRLK